MLLVFWIIGLEPVVACPAEPELMHIVQHMFHLEHQPSLLSKCIAVINPPPSIDALAILCRSGPLGRSHDGRPDREKMTGRNGSVGNWLCRNCERVFGIVPNYVADISLGYNADIARWRKAIVLDLKMNLPRRFSVIDIFLERTRINKYISPQLPLTRPFAFVDGLSRQARLSVGGKPERKREGCNRYGGYRSKKPAVCING